ncbi:MAG: M23 family metallopeptidase [Acidimicrobiales bacterium]
MAPTRRTRRRCAVAAPLTPVLAVALAVISALTVAGPGAASPAAAQDPPPATASGPDAPAGTDAATTSTTDPLLNEEAGETVPSTPDTVPAPVGSYDGQKPYQPARVLRSNVQAAERKLADVRWMQTEMIRQAHEAKRLRKDLQLRQQSLDAQSLQATHALQDAEATMKERAVAAFVSNDGANEALLHSFESADHDSVLDLEVRQRLLGVALDSDAVAIDDYHDLRSQLSGDLVATVDELRTTETTLTDLEAQAEAATAAVRQAENELAAFRAGSAIYIDGVVFPIAGPYNRPLVGTFGAPRMPGTPDAHWHQGIDIFAPAGTPLVAAERGVVTKVGSNRLGGLTVWLHGESGTDWYYAHLLAHAPDLVAGQVVEAGTLLGYVGNTGNAATTPSHLHLEMHPNGADAVDPFPLLNVIAQRDAVAGR